MLKILHIADIHLDSRFNGVPLAESVKRRAELRNIFKNALDFAKSEGCAVTLISGDLFDSEYYTKDTLDFLCQAFSAMPECRFIIAPGNHDPYNATSPYRLGIFPKNVHVFDSEELTALEIEELSLVLYGYAFTSAAYSKDPLNGLVIGNKKAYNVLCAHTDLDTPLSSYAPISSKTLSAFDYAALGHIHTKEEIVWAGNTCYAYSGCIAGRDFSEYGEKGGILVTLDKNSGKKTVNAQRVRFCPWIYHTEAIDLTGTGSEAEACAVIVEKLKPYKRLENSEYILRLRLTGEINYELDADSIVRRFTALGVTEVQNETVNSYGALNLDDDYSLRGEFYRALKPMLLSDDPAERKNAAMALKYGLGALSGSEIEI